MVEEVLQQMCVDDATIDKLWDELDDLKIKEPELTYISGYSCTIPEEHAWKRDTDPKGMFFPVPLILTKKL